MSDASGDDIRVLYLREYCENVLIALLNPTIDMRPTVDLEAELGDGWLNRMSEIHACDARDVLRSVGERLPAELGLAVLRLHAP